MSKIQLPLTRMTLLTSIRESSGVDAPEEKRRRAEFIDLYTPVIERWCRTWGLREVEAEEVAFGVVEKVLDKLSTYDSAKGRFRCWLKAVTRRAVIDHFEMGLTFLGGESLGERQGTIVSPRALEDLGEELDRATDPRIDLLPTAVERVRSRVQAHIWSAFYENKVLLIPAFDVAQGLGVKPSVVHNAVCKVKNMLKEEIEALQGQREI